MGVSFRFRAFHRRFTGVSFRFRAFHGRFIGVSRAFHAVHRPYSVACAPPAVGYALLPSLALSGAAPEPHARACPETKRTPEVLRSAAVRVEGAGASDRASTTMAARRHTFSHSWAVWGRPGSNWSWSPACPRWSWSAPRLVREADGGPPAPCAPTLSLFPENMGARRFASAPQQSGVSTRAVTGGLRAVARVVMMQCRALRE